MTPKEEILYLVENNPKKYSVMVRANPRLKQWVDDNSLVTSDSFAEHVYSAVNQTDGICKNGKKKQFRKWNVGYIGCGHASVCECTRESIANSRIQITSSYSADEKEKQNDKRKNTMIEKYGVEYNSQLTSFKNSIARSQVSPEISEKLANKDWLYEEYVVKKRSAVDIAHELGVHYTSVTYHCKKNGFESRRKSKKI